VTDLKVTDLQEERDLTIDFLVIAVIVLVVTVKGVARGEAGEISEQVLDVTIRVIETEPQIEEVEIKIAITETKGAIVVRVRRKAGFLKFGLRASVDVKRNRKRITNATAKVGSSVDRAHDQSLLRPHHHLRRVHPVLVEENVVRVAVAADPNQSKSTGTNLKMKKRKKKNHRQKKNQQKPQFDFE